MGWTSDRTTVIIAVCLAMAPTACATTSADEPTAPGPDTVVGTAPEADESAGPSQNYGLDDVQISGADRGEVIELNFDYADAGSARVTTTTNGLPMKIEKRVDFEPKNDGFQLIYSQVTPSLTGDVGYHKRQLNERLRNAFAGLQYTMVVDSVAGIADIDGFAEVQKASRTARLTGNRRVDELTNDIQNALFDAGHIDQQIVAQWVFMVQLWAGNHLKIGRQETAHFTGYYPTGSRGFHRVTIDVAYVVAGRVRCRPGDAKRRCVRLRLRAVPNAQQLSVGARRVGAKVRQSVPKRHRDAMPKLGAMRSSMDLTLVVESDTLLPHHMAQTVHDHLELASGASKDVEVTTTNEYRYSQ